MTRHDQLLAAITADPEDDAARRAFADHIRPSDPDRAAFIEQQLAQAQARRQARGPRTTADDRFLVRHEAEWTRTLARYTARLTFDRGFVAAIRIDPYLFLEYGEWLFHQAPIRCVELSKPADGRFPMAELAASPLLARLDAISLHDETLRRADLERLADSPHLDRVLVLGSVALELDGSVYSDLARNPQLRKALALRLSDDGYPGQRFEPTGDYDLHDHPIHAWTAPTLEAAALEARHGYLPWLHHENLCEPLDAAWYVTRGILPVTPPGSPVG